MTAERNRLERFIIVDSTSSLLRAAEESLASGLFPVIAPSSTKRLSRWLRALAWYDDLLRESTWQKPHFDHRGTVICVDSEFAPIAELLAIASGWQLEVMTDGNTLLPHQDGVLGPVTYVGSPKHLDAARARIIASSTARPWTVITGLDLPGATFAVAKLLALHSHVSPPATWALLDGFADRATRVDPTGQDLDLGRLEPTILELNMNGGVVLHVHGEGAHGDLRRMVLCGRTGPVERGPDGRIIPGGCCGEDYGDNCKRRATRHQLHLPFYELRNQRVVLLSCNGYSTNYETYPSDLSAAVSCLEGYAAEVFTTLRPMSFPTGLPLALTKVAAAKQGFEMMAPIARDVALRRGFADTFVHIGLILDAAVAPTTASYRLTPNLYVCRLDSLSSSAAISITHNAIRGAQNVYVLNPNESGVPEPVDASSSISDREIWLERMTLRLEWARRWMRYFARGVLSNHEVPDFMGQLAELENATEALDDALLTAETALMRSYQEGQIATLFDPAMELVSVAVAGWDSRCAALLNQTYLAFRAELFHHGWREPGLATRHACERCGALIEKHIVRSVLKDCGNLVATTCPNCGDRDLQWDSEIHWHVSVPTTIAAGSELWIDAGRSADCQFHRLGGWILTQLRDKSAGTELARSIVKTNEQSALVGLTVPPDCSPDLHTVTVIWVENLTLAFGRRRTACVPSLDRSHS